MAMLSVLVCRCYHWTAAQPVELLAKVNLGEVALKEHDKMTLRFDPEVIQMIRCPVTKSRLSEAPASVIAALNDQIEQGEIKNRIGQVVKTRLDGGFINESRTLILPVQGGIVILISEEAIEIKSAEAPQAREPINE
jgi:uncharacterized protein YbaR (Trm112 family)